LRPEGPKAGVGLPAMVLTNTLPMGSGRSLVL